MNDTLYPFASRQILKNPKRYSRSKYWDKPFLEAWRVVRAEAELENGCTAPNVVAPEKPVANGPVPTPRLLDFLFTAVSSDQPLDDETTRWIDALTKKFEVTKRVHGGYDEAFLAVDKEDHRDLLLYVRLAEVFEATYARTRKLPLLNALLKIMDTLCALRDDLRPEDRNRLSGLIGRERAHVESLAEQVGVRI